MDKNYLKLVQSFDALFPIGGFTLSNGMETYVQKGIVHDEKSCEEHLQSYLYILGFNDLAFAAKAAKSGNIKRYDEICSAYKTSFEIREGSVKQCLRFLKLHTQLGEYENLSEYYRLIKNGECDGHYCVAVGLFIRDIKTDVLLSLELYAYNMISSMVNHAAKLVPLRQLDAQRVLLSIMDKIRETVIRAMDLDESELGSSGIGFDIRSMQHETLYSRLYIS